MNLPTIDGCPQQWERELKKALVEHKKSIKQFFADAWEYGEKTYANFRRKLDREYEAYLASLRSRRGGPRIPDIVKEFIIALRARPRPKKPGRTAHENYPARR